MQHGAMGSALHRDLHVRSGGLERLNAHMALSVYVSVRAYKCMSGPDQALAVLVY